MIWRRLASLISTLVSTPSSAQTSPSALLDVWSVSARHSLQYRQGDLLFVSRPGIPAGMVTSEVTRPDAVIERGELTGHAHRLEGGAVYDRDGRMYLEVNPGGRVVHEEHDTLELPEGWYVVVRQREYRGEEEWTHVRD